MKKLSLLLIIVSLIITITQCTTKDDPVAEESATLYSELEVFNRFQSFPTAPVPEINAFIVYENSLEGTYLTWVKEEMGSAVSYYSRFEEDSSWSTILSPVPVEFCIHTQYCGLLEGVPGTTCPIPPCQLIIEGGVVSCICGTIVQ